MNLLSFSSADCLFFFPFIFTKCLFTLSCYTCFIHCVSVPIVRLFSLFITCFPFVIFLCLVFLYVSSIFLTCQFLLFLIPDALHPVQTIHCNIIEEYEKPTLDFSLLQSQPNWVLQGICSLHFHVTIILLFWFRTIYCFCRLIIIVQFLFYDQSLT